MVGNHLFVIFAVLDVSCAVNSCINNGILHLLLLLLMTFVERKVKIKYTKCAIIVHYTVTQRQFFSIFPFLQTNITSQMCPSGGNGGGTVSMRVEQIQVQHGLSSHSDSEIIWHKKRDQENFGLSPTNVQKTNKKFTSEKLTDSSSCGKEHVEKSLRNGTFMTVYTHALCTK